MRVTFLAIGMCGVLCCGSAAGEDNDLDGAWATDAGACSKIFVQKQGKVSLASNSDAYGSGFVIEENRVRGKLASCRVERRRRADKLVTFIAICSTDIALSTIQFNFRLYNENHITRLFPGMEGMEVDYYRCSRTEISK